MLNEKIIKISKQILEKFKEELEGIKTIQGYPSKELIPYSTYYPVADM